MEGTEQRRDRGAQVGVGHGGDGGGDLHGVGVARQGIDLLQVALDAPDRTRVRGAATRGALTPSEDTR